MEGRVNVWDEVVDGSGGGRERRDGVAWRYKLVVASKAILQQAEGGEARCRLDLKRWREMQMAGLGFLRAFCAVGSRWWPVWNGTAAVRSSGVSDNELDWPTTKE